MYRAAKNDSGIILEIGNDEGQSGDTNSGNHWCAWTFADIPAWSIPAGCPTDRPMMFKENATADGIEVRSDAEVNAAPNG